MCSLLSRAALAGGLATQAYAYTQVNIAQPFMYKTIDPIVFPGEYTKSHLHSFFGSDAVTASTSTSAELQEGCTNVENPNDLSVYWVPTLVYTTDGENYEPVPLSRFSAYYNLGETPAEIAIPQDVQMLAGDASATSADTTPADAKVEWFCEGDDGIEADENGFPSSTCSTHLQTLLYFPQCVNEDTLETAYKSRDYGTDNWCPEGSKSMAQLRFSIRYDLRDVLPDGWSGTAPIKLACGNAWCSHGDFINGWTTEAAENMVATTSDKQEFAAVNGALGNDGDEPTCEATDAEPDKGTSDYGESVAQMSKRFVEYLGWKSQSRVR
ncbi:hypothetical protein N0V82_001673 [Gnomoniopsis sp. IMI 355080]|nr:hypothetical protein N0V82_001673 [Gnomoniopsis sp. IMI 355080]